ncbi:hypothetical protein F0562_002933 [Nyssa sinensis]|uniref:Uncharacterized protein n=1 Tax=Nyssa sinensis TaxID=561372 RepID=A0A5J5BU85_9ASTE|nr:hypothetical protein F0562_002933 [Nyssa sinensis]
MHVDPLEDQLEESTHQTQKDPTAATLRNKRFPYYDQWCIIFGKDRATGEIVEGPCDAVKDIDHGEGDDAESNINTNIDGIEPSISVSQSPINDNVGTSQPNGSKKKSRSGDLLANSMSEMAEAFKGFVDDSS